MKNNKVKVIKIVRPMRLWFKNFRTLMRDIFNPTESVHKWLRYPMYAIDKKHKEIILSGLIEELNQEIKVKSYDL
jgi:hypothetical protein